MLPEEEKKNIIDTMNYNSLLLSRMLLMLYDSSETGQSQEGFSYNLQQEMVSCNDVARESISYIYKRFPGLHIDMKTEVPDDFCIMTCRQLLMITIRELLYNSAKYSDDQHIGIRVSSEGDAVRFVMEDTGKGIPEAEIDQLFKFFTKVDDLSEGLGLGLPLSKRHAKSLGGDLVLDTTFREGCRFVLTLPLSQQESPASSAPQSE
jgi:signal transduction histidine kinase